MSGEVVHPKSFARHTRTTQLELEAEVSRLRRLLDTKQASLESLIITNKNIRRQINTLNIQLKRTADENQLINHHISMCNENIEVLKEQRLRMETHGQQQRYYNIQLKTRVERLLVNSRLKTNKLKRTNNENIKLHKENILLKKGLIKMQAQLNENNMASFFHIFLRKIKGD